MESVRDKALPLFQVQSFLIATSKLYLGLIYPCADVVGPPKKPPPPWV